MGTRQVGVLPAAPSQPAASAVAGAVGDPPALATHVHRGGRRGIVDLPTRAYSRGFERGFLRGFSPETVVPPWAGAGDPANDGAILTALSWIEGGLAFAPSAWVIVSPIGLANGCTKPNNGAPFGPDTPGTTTSGINEALNALLAITAQDTLGNNLAGHRGTLLLLAGIYRISTPIVCPPGMITIVAQGMSAYYTVETITPYQDLGGTVIVSSGAQCFSCPPDSHNAPATALSIPSGIEFRIVDPASAQTTSNAAVVDLTGVASGNINGITVLDVLSSGGIGNNAFRLLDIAAGSNVDHLTITNYRLIGGNQCFNTNRAHMSLIKGIAGMCNNTVSAYGCCYAIYGEQDQVFMGMQSYDSVLGIIYVPYGSDAHTPLVLYGPHFEALTHYINIGAGATTGKLVFINPCWNVVGLDPVLDIAATCPSTFSFESYYEQDQTGLYSPTKPLHFPSPGEVRDWMMVGF